MILFLEVKNGNEDVVLENVREWNESVHDRKIYVSYEDGKENETYSMIQYMAVELDEEYENIIKGLREVGSKSMSESPWSLKEYSEAVKNLSAKYGEGIVKRDLGLE